jgi:hypothetical protein
MVLNDFSIYLTHFHGLLTPHLNGPPSIPKHCILHYSYYPLSPSFPTNTLYFTI